MSSRWFDIKNRHCYFNQERLIPKQFFAITIAWQRGHHQTGFFSKELQNELPILL